MVATMEHPTREIVSATADPAPPKPGKDGTLVRVWLVDGEEVEFSLAEIPVAKRETYWYGRPGQQMWWRAQVRNAHGLQPVIQKEAWIDGRFTPRNAWEVHMTREWLSHPERNIDPDKAKGENHPEGPGHAFRCDTCGWPCPNWYIFRQHQRALNHTGMRSD